MLPPGKRTLAHPDNYLFASIKTKNALFGFSGETFYLFLYLMVPLSK